MLQSLKVQNYALIEELSVEFQQGLNIITGETGAGKSILLGALGMILGKRADTSVLSNQDNKCVVEAEFNISNYNLRPFFAENDIDYEQLTVLRREILNSGKSRAFINDTPVTLNILQDLAQQLVDIHSQHQNLLLNSEDFVLQIIDSYSTNQVKISAYQQAFSEFRSLERNYKEKLLIFERVRGEMDFIAHQVNELENAKLIPDELEMLEQELSQMENSGEIKAALHEADNLMNLEETGIIDSLHTVESRLLKITPYYNKAEDISNRLSPVLIELKDIQSAITKSFEGLEFDPGQLEKTRTRVDLLNSLLQKYRCSTIEGLIQLYQDIKSKYSVATDGEFELSNLKKQLDSAENEAIEKATALTEARAANFEKLSESLREMLVEMGMEYCSIRFEREQKELSISGADSIRFLFTANKNHPLQDITKIASGGELSRLMLSVKALLAGTTGMPTLILDEIDTGVSGEIADKVGRIIRQMSGGTQVINITHLPQVASKGQVHFLVYKDHNHSVTKTKIRMLSSEERILEIAKMLSGEQLTDAALNNARELLRN